MSGDSLPSGASGPVPRGIRAALDLMSEGAVLLDDRGRILAANRAFAEALGTSADQLQGREVSALPWAPPDSNNEPYQYPWEAVLRDGQTCHGVPVNLQAPSSGIRRFVVNAAPVSEDGSAPRGALAVFTDLCEIEERNARLREALEVSAKAQEEIIRQNAELQLLATRDALTGCLNRRAFLESAEVAWSASKRYQYDLGVVMIDIDHFKWVNDRYGHATGDQILRKVGATLQQSVRESDVVCRYGGEEFCLLLLHTGSRGAVVAAEKARRAIQLEVKELPVTVSLGVSATDLGAPGLHEALDQADQALYAAKKAGRDCVVGWDPVAGQDGEKRPVPLQEEPQIDDPGSMHISIQAVNALMATLEYRDMSTAEHSRQVAELCVRTAESLMPPSDCFVLEVAALLHDIGKLGVPDSILLKPGPLTDEEWAVIHRHNVIGAEIIAAAFACRELTETVRYGQAWNGECQNEPGLPAGKRIPLRARILMLADAFSSMTSDRPWRKALSPEEAFKELRRNSGPQFDPELVELFIQKIAEGQGEGGAPDTHSNESMLTIGRMAESLAESFKAQDTHALGVVAERLAAVAAKQGMAPIASVASELHTATRKRLELKRIMQLTTRLLDLCGHLRDAPPAAETKGREPLPTAAIPPS